MPSLKSQNDPLAIVENQLQILRPGGTFVPFLEKLADQGCAALTRKTLKTFQLNLGRMCNMTCQHCHVDAGPDRQEIMTRATMQECLDAMRVADPDVVDLTGGAPEMNPDFRWLVEQLSAQGRHVIDRCNLTILLVPKYHDLVEFLAEHQVEIVSSLPFYTASTTDRQRGDKAFERAVDALQRLNQAGYGQADSGLLLNLVYNPNGAFLPGDQQELEATYKRRLKESHGIVFNSLYAITNQPINRFLAYLERSGNYEGYMKQLIDAYNPAAVDDLMCRDTVSVSWDGYVYDCDFNQMLALAMAPPVGPHLSQVDWTQLDSQPIQTGLHCYACTAGQGSSCTGRTA